MAVLHSLILKSSITALRPILLYSVYFDKSVCFTEYIELPYNLNTFSFQFSSLDYRSPYKVVYEYMLEGVDNSWISTSAFHREAFYTKLSSGEYMFRLRVRNTDGVYSSNELSIPVIITLLSGVHGMLIHFI